MTNNHGDAMLRGWQWIATTTRLHLVKMCLCGQCGPHPVEDDRRRAITLCGVGIAPDVTLHHLGCTCGHKPPACKLCLARWEREAITAIELEDARR